MAYLTVLNRIKCHWAFKQKQNHTNTCNSSSDTTGHRYQCNS